MGPQPQVVAHVPSVVRYCCQATAKMGQVDHLAWAYDFDGSILGLLIVEKKGLCLHHEEYQYAHGTDMVARFFSDVLTNLPTEKNVKHF